MPLLARLAGAASIAAFLLSAALAAEPVSFADTIQPLLETKCLACHGPDQKLAGLDLSTREGMLKGGVHGAAVAPGEPDKSNLYRYLSGLEQPAMPLGGQLTKDEIAAVRQWIAEGAEWSAASAAVRKSDDEEPTWWAFQAPVDRTPPEAPDPRWNRTAIDRFVHAKLAEQGLQPAPPADKRTLIRRVYLDLIGLPPNPDEVAEFMADSSPDAFERVVERLLASPRYGERWGRHWLDVARYADSAGYEHDFDYPNAWRYRDYVIRSFNDDKPYDRFVREQLAGDELPDADFDALIATGFHRIGPRVLYREKDNPDYRYNYLDDMIQTTSRAFLGLSVECARCHDHKFDPIQQLDYYRMLAIFFPHIRYDFPLASDEEIAEYERRKADVEGRIAPLRERIGEIEEPYREASFQQKLNEFPEDIQIAVRTPEEQRTEGQKLLAQQVRTIRGTASKERMTSEDRAEVVRLEGEVKALREQMPEPLPTTMGIRDGDYRSAPDGAGDEVQPGKGNRINYQNVGPWIPTEQTAYEPPTAHLLSMGDYRSPGDAVEPGLLSALATPADFRPEPPGNGRVSTGRRLALANWIVSEDNPLTARVMANRVWQHHFGEGIVATPSNFGKMGLRPTHPELLDHLALEFVRSGWSVKSLHRKIVATETYRMASAHDDPAAREADPDNRLLWKYPRRRLEGEIIRDLALAVAGNLNGEVGGEPFFPPIPEKVRASYLNGRWEMTEQSPPVWRRSVYSYYKRGLRFPLLEVFDLPNPNVTCERRATTTVPTQALTLLNNEFVLEQAGRFAARVRSDAGAEARAQVRRLYEIALSRPPSEVELEGNLAFLARQKDYHATQRADDPALAALTDLCDVVLNLNEMVYLP